MFALQLKAGDVLSESCSMSFCLVWSRIQPCAQAPGLEREGVWVGSSTSDSGLQAMPWCRHGVRAGMVMISFSVRYLAHQAVLMPSLQSSLGPLIPP